MANCLPTVPKKQTFQQSLEKLHIGLRIPVSSIQLGLLNSTVQKSHVSNHRGARSTWKAFLTMTSLIISAAPGQALDVFAKTNLFAALKCPENRERSCMNSVYAYNIVLHLWVGSNGKLREVGNMEENILPSYHVQLL